MNTVIPVIRIGQPLRYEALSVFPLSSDTESTVKYLLEKEAFRNDAIVVKEINNDGVVSELKVENRCNCLVLLLEGSELAGAKQNRVLNCDVLVPTYQTITLPVSLRGAGPVGLQVGQVHGQWMPLSLAAATHAQGIGRRGAQGKARAPFRPAGHLEGSCPPTGVVAGILHDQGDGGYVQIQPRPHQRFP